MGSRLLSFNKRSCADTNTMFNSGHKNRLPDVVNCHLKKRQNKIEVLVKTVAHSIRSHWSRVVDCQDDFYDLILYGQDVPAADTPSHEGAKNPTAKTASTRMDSLL